MSSVHPSLVYFPIVLTLLGALLSVIAVFFTRHGLSMYLAIVLAVASAGGWVAVNTGQKAVHRAEEADQLAEEIRPALESHQNWANRTVWAISLAAALSVMAAETTMRKRRGAVAWRVVAAIVALTASGFILVTAGRGGDLVVTYGLGVDTAHPVPAMTGFGTAPAVDETQTDAPPSGKASPSDDAPPVGDRD